MSRSSKEADLIINELINKMWYIQTLGYHLAFKKKIPIYSPTWMKLENIMLGDIFTCQQPTLCHLGPCHHPELPWLRNFKLHIPASENNLLFFRLPLPHSCYLETPYSPFFSHSVSLHWALSPYLLHFNRSHYSPQFALFTIFVLHLPHKTRDRPWINFLSHSYWGC